MKNYKYITVKESPDVQKTLKISSEIKSLILFKNCRQSGTTKTYTYHELKIKFEDNIEKVRFEDKKKAKEAYSEILITLNSF